MDQRSYIYRFDTFITVNEIEPGDETEQYAPKRLVGSGIESICVAFETMIDEKYGRFSEDKPCIESLRFLWKVFEAKQKLTDERYGTGQNSFTGLDQKE
ncbi:hypothetical protein [Spirosoma oryzae]|uniref:hypothetical protein n=1 Tax=Spirosoma oryzae TaxID=1469603 RepID=UPI0011B22802|nr:hypothetical protein [Spirosoma oryzae]